MIDDSDEDEDEYGDYPVTIWFTDRGVYEEAKSGRFRGILHTAVRELFAKHPYSKEGWELLGDCSVGKDITDDRSVVPDLYYISSKCVQRTAPRVILCRSTLSF